MGMIGSIAANFHEGSRSEYLAQYVFSSWGTAVAVPHQEDHGLDLFCTFMETIGGRAWARSPYTVQVKSEMRPWVFEGRESVKWLVEHPLPLFLCVVDKPNSTLSVYHTAPRFLVWSLGDLPDKLTMIPTVEIDGRDTQWTGTFELSLSAPILKIEVARIGNDAYWENARKVMERWIDVDNHNLTLIRAGLLRFRMPAEYKTNLASVHAVAEQGNARPPDELLRRGVLHLSECLNCLGSQFHYSENALGAVEAGLLYHHLRRRFPQFFDERDSHGGFSPVFNRLTEKMPNIRKDYLFAGIEEIERLVESALPPASAKSDRKVP
jgi:hypothetical protein